jgi:hypothetical protein
VWEFLIPPVQGWEFYLLTRLSLVTPWMAGTGAISVISPDTVVKVCSHGFTEWL